MSDVRAAWGLDFGVRHLNHGSFGAALRAALDEQQALRDRMERNPMEFFARAWWSLHDAAREALARFVGAGADDLAAVPNATAGVNAVLRSLRLEPGDELVTTDHAYNACTNALRFVAEGAGARVRVARVPFPLRDEGEVVEAVLAEVTPRTRLVMVDHVTSPTALVLPVERLVGELRARGVDALVDGAHAPGMVPLDLDGLGAAYYTGNLHKWVCAPKGAAFLHVRRDRQAGVRPIAISHGANAPLHDRSRFRLEFDWTGTCDPTAFLSAPRAIEAMAALSPGGWGEVRARNRAMALRARGALCEALGVAPPQPDPMVGSMAAVPLPAGLVRQGAPGDAVDPLQRWLFERHRIEVPIIAWPDADRRLVRVSAQLYNRHDEHDALAAALREAQSTSQG